MTTEEVARLRDDLKRDEALRLYAYDDATGKPLRKGDTLQGQLSIGWGHNLSARGLAQDFATQLLDDDIRVAVSDLFRAWPWMQTLDGPRQVVLANMCFNMGAPALATFTHFLDFLQRGDYESASIAMLDSQWAEQVGPRATRLASVIHSGELKA